MEPSIFFPNRVRFVPRIQNRPVVHRVDAQIRLHKVGSLGQLIVARHESALLTFHADLAGSSNDLPADKERQQPRSQRREGNRPREKIVIVTAVTVSVKVRVVLVELHMGPAERMVTALRRPLDNALTGTVMSKNI